MECYAKGNQASNKQTRNNFEVPTIRGPKPTVNSWPPEARGRRNSATLVLYLLAIPMNSIDEATDQGGRRPSHTGFRLTP